MRPWIIYTRVSTDDQAQQGVSLEAQEAALRALITTRTQGPVELLTDPGISGATLDRPGLQAALARIDAGEIAGIAVWKLDRLTRSLRDLLDLVERLQAADCQLVSMQESIDTSGPIGRFQISLLGALAQLEREQIGERVRMARAHMKREGRWAGGPIPPGCTVISKDGKRYLQRDPKLAPIVEKIWPMVIGGATLADVCDHLTRHNIPTTQGKGWTKTSARGLMIRKSVVGHLVDAKTQAQAIEALSGRAGSFGNPATNGKGRPRTATRPWPLQHIAFCAHCGARLLGVIAGRNHRAYLRCGTRARQGAKACPQRDLPADTYEAAVVEALVQELATHDTAIEALLQDHLEEVRRRAINPEDQAHRKQLTLTRDKLATRLANLTAMAADATTTAERTAIRTQSTETAQQIDTIEAELLTTQAKADALAFTEQQIIAATAALKAGLQALPQATPEQLATILPGLIHRITIHENSHLQIDLLLPTPTTTTAQQKPGRHRAGSKTHASWLVDLHTFRISPRIRTALAHRGRKVVSLVR